MDDAERQAAEQHLALGNWVLAAQERRHEVIDVVWGAANKEQAAERLRELLGIDGGDPFVVLDLPIGRLTKEAREQFAAKASQLRKDLDQN